MSKADLRDAFEELKVKAQRTAAALNKQRNEIGLTNQLLTNALSVGAGASLGASVDGFLAGRGIKTQIPMSALVGVALGGAALMPNSIVPAKLQSEVMFMGAACLAYPIARSIEGKVAMAASSKPQTPNAVAGVVGYAPPPQLHAPAQHPGVYYGHPPQPHPFALSPQPQPHSAATLANQLWALAA